RAAAGEDIQPPVVVLESAQPCRQHLFHQVAQRRDEQRTTGPGDEQYEPRRQGTHHVRQNKPACGIEGYERESDVNHPEDRSCRYAQTPAGLWLQHHEGNDEESADDRDRAPQRPGSENRSVTDYGVAIHTERPGSYQEYSNVSPISGKVS